MILLNSIQTFFELTGVTHASVAFDNNGNVIASREDVGRHNALDKLIGYRMTFRHPTPPATCDTIHADAAASAAEDSLVTDSGKKVVL